MKTEMKRKLIAAALTLTTVAVCFTLTAFSLDAKRRTTSPNGSETTTYSVDPDLRESTEIGTFTETETFCGGLPLPYDEQTTANGAQTTTTLFDGTNNCTPEPPEEEKEFTENPLRVYMKEDVEAEVGKTAEVEILLANTNRLRGLHLLVSYDREALTLQNAASADTGLLDGFEFKYKELENCCSFAWVGMNPSNAEGVLLKLSFLVNKSGQYPVDLTVSNVAASDMDWKIVHPEVRAAGGLVSSSDIAAELTVSASKETVGCGETAEVKISIEGNKGIRALGLVIDYDKSAMTISTEDLRAANSGLLGKMFTINDTEDGIWVAWANSKPIEGDGVILTLKFKAGDAEGVYPIKITVDKASTNDPEHTGDFRQIPTETDEGNVTIKKSGTDNSAILLGDVDGNGVLNADDGFYLMLHVLFADVYPISEHAGITNGDVDGNGVLNADDGFYLMLFVLFPDAYPLH